MSRCLLYCIVFAKIIQNENASEHAMLYSKYCFVTLLWGHNNVWPLVSKKMRVPQKLGREELVLTFLCGTDPSSTSTCNVCIIPPENRHPTPCLCRILSIPSSIIYLLLDPLHRLIIFTCRCYGIKMLIFSSKQGCGFARNWCNVIKHNSAVGTTQEMGNELK